MKSFDFIRTTDFSKYEMVVVWYTLEANSLIFLYMLCRFVSVDLHVRYYRKLDDLSFKLISVSMGLSAALDIQMGNIDLCLSADKKQYFADIYDSFAGKPRCAKKVDKSDILTVSDEELCAILLNHCSAEYQSAARVILQASMNLGFHLDFCYLHEKLADLVKEGRVIARKKKLDKPVKRLVSLRRKMYNGINLADMDSFEVCSCCSE